ncbi:MAG: hypothetical protein AB7V32_09070, partial [Candidatus Berkiella sp.]
MKAGVRRKKSNNSPQVPSGQMFNLEVTDISQYLDDPVKRASIPNHVVLAFELVRALGDQFVLECSNNVATPMLRKLSILTFIGDNQESIITQFDIFATYVFNKIFNNVEKLIKEKSEDNLLACYACLNALEAFIQHILPLVSENDRYINTREAFVGFLLKYTSISTSAIISLLDAKTLKPKSYYFWYQAIIEKMDALILYGKEYQAKFIKLLDANNEDDSNIWVNVKYFLGLYKTSYHFCLALKLDSHLVQLEQDMDDFCGYLRGVCASKSENPKAQEVNELITSIKVGVVKNNEDLLNFFREMDDYIQNQDLKAPKEPLENLKLFKEDCKATELALKALTAQSEPAQAIRLFNQVLRLIKQSQVLPYEQCQEETFKTLLRALYHAQMVLRIPELINDTFLRCIMEDMFNYFIKKLTEDLRKYSATVKRAGQLEELEAQLKMLNLGEKPDALLQEEEQQHQAELEKIRSEHAKALAAQRQMIAQEAEKLRKERAQEHAQEIARLKEALEAKLLQEVGELNSRNAQRMLKAEQQRERQIRDLEQSHSDKIAALRKEEQDKKDELEIQNAAALQALQTKRDSELKAAKAKHAKNMTQTQDRLKRQLVAKTSKLESESEALIVTAQLEHEQALKALEEDFQAQEQAQVKEFEQKHADQLKALEAEFQRAKAQHAQKLSLQRTHLVGQVSAQLESARKKYQQRHEQESAVPKKLSLKDPFTQVALAPEHQFILACLGERECYITGQWLRNAILKRPVNNVPIEVLVKGNPNELGPISQASAKNPDFPNVLQMGSIVFNCIGESNFTDVLRQRLLVLDSLICDPQTGNVYNVLSQNEHRILNPLKVFGDAKKRFKENPNLIFQLFRAHYELQFPFVQEDLEAIKCHAGLLTRFPMVSYQEMLQSFFLSQHGASNYCYAFQNDMLHHFFPFLPQRYAQVLTTQCPLLRQFWSDKIASFLAQPQQYHANHILALIFMFKVLQK